MIIHQTDQTDESSQNFLIFYVIIQFSCPFHVTEKVLQTTFVLIENFPCFEYFPPTPKTGRLQVYTYKFPPTDLANQCVASTLNSTLNCSEKSSQS